MDGESKEGQQGQEAIGKMGQKGSRWMVKVKEVSKDRKPEERWDRKEVGGW